MYKILVSEKNLNLDDLNEKIVNTFNLIDNLKLDEKNFNKEKIPLTTLSKFEKYFKFSNKDYRLSESLEKIYFLKNFQVEHLNEYNNLNLEYSINQGIFLLLKKVKNILHKVDNQSSYENLLFQTHTCFCKLFECFNRYYYNGYDLTLYYLILIEQYQFNSHFTYDQLHKILNHKLSKKETRTLQVQEIEYLRTLQKKAITKNTILFYSKSNLIQEKFESYSLFFISIIMFHRDEDQEFLQTFVKENFDDIVKLNNVSNFEFNKIIMIFPSLFLAPLRKINFNLIKEFGLVDEFNKLVNESLENI